MITKSKIYVGGGFRMERLYNTDDSIDLFENITTHNYFFLNIYSILFIKLKRLFHLNSKFLMVKGYLKFY